MDNESIKNKTQKLFIEPLEQRIMLDGAGASTFLDLIDERNQQQIKINSSNKDIYKEGENSNKDIPFTNITRDKIRNDKKNIVFIDSAVEDYETITSSFKENTEFYLINANEDGFKKISEILKDKENIDALHLIGHGSSGQILFGNAFLNNETIDNYQATLTSIGQSLTTSGDILFYGCNIASTEQGEILIKKISEITKADIAASDDLTGKDGNWDLEKEEGFINVKELKVQHYDHSLGSLSSHSGAGISHKDSNVTVITSSSSNRNLGLKDEGLGGLVDHGDGFGIALERQNISISSGTLISQVDVDSDYSLSKSTSGVSDSYAYLTGDSEQNASENMTVDSYLMFLGAKNTIFGSSTGGLNRRSSTYSGEVVFEGEIVGIFFDQSRTRGQEVDGITYHNTSTYTYDFDESSPHTESNQYDTDKGRILEPGSFFGNDTSSTDSSGDWVSVGNYGSGTNNYLRFGADNNSVATGDYIRIIVKQAITDGSATVEEDGSVSVSNGWSASSPDPVTVDSGSTLSSSSTTPRRMTFSDDGTKLFILDYANDKIDIHNLGTAYDISTQTSSPTVDIALAGTPHTSAYGIEFSTDGTKMFTSDLSTGYVYQWTLTTPWDVSTNQRSASDDLDTRSLFGVTLSGGYYNRDITFSEDGTKLFILGSDRTVHQISLGTAWDLSSYQTPDIENDLSSTLTTCNSISFSPNGKKMFINEINKKIHEWSLATAWDLSSTVTYEGNFQSGSEISSSNYGEVTWNKDGTKLFILDGVVDDVTEYSVSTPFSLANVDQTKSAESISTVSSIRTGQSGGSGTSGSTNTALTGTYGQLTIQSNGSYSYVANQDAADALDAGDVVYDYFTINGDTDLTITVIGINDTPIADDETNSTDVSTTLTVTDGASDLLTNDSDDDADASLTISQIVATTAGGSAQSVSSTSTYSSNYTTAEGSYGDLRIGADGTYHYIAGSSSGTDEFTYTVTDEFGATTTATLTITVNATNTAPTATADTGYIQEGKTLTVTNGLAAEDGSDLDDNNESGDHTGDVLENDTDADVGDSLTITSYSHTSSTGQGGAAGGSNSNTGTAGSSSVAGTYGTLDLEDDGSYTYTADSNITNLDTDDETFTDVFTYTVSDGNGGTATATITITIEASGDVTAQNDTGSVNEDATLTVDNSYNATSVAAASYSDSDSLTIAGSDSSPATTQNRLEDMIFNDDGTKMYVLGYESGVSGGSLFQYTLSTPFDVSIASVSSDDYINVGSRTENNEAIRFNNDGTKLFVLADSTGQNVTSYMHQYTLSTPYDITSTVTEGTRKTLGTSSTDNFRSFLFNDDGSKMFVSRGVYIYEYTLSTSFDTSTASSPDNSFYVTNSSYGLSNYGSSYSITGMQYNSDGTKLFTVHQTTTINHTAKIVEWSLSTAYDPTTASTNADFNDTSTYFETGDTTTASLSPTHFITFNNDGSKFFSFSDHAVFGDTLKIKEWNVSSPFSMLSTSGSHSGDIIDTSSSSNSDTDADGDSLTITYIQHSGAGSATSVTDVTYSNGSATSVTGTYGTLTIGSDGSYQYVADLDAADALDAGDIETDVFTYTVDDGNGETDTATLTITVIGINDAPTAVADTDSVDAGSTVTDTTNSAGTLVADDSDPDDSASLYITQITGNGNTSSVTYNSTKISNAATIVGSKGTLTFGSDGSYSYAADSDATSGDDVFTYTLTDGTSTSTATLTISVTEVANNAPTAADNAVTTNEDTDHTFSASEFGFTDVDSDSLDHVTIETLPTEGTLLLDGVAVSAGDEIATADITNLVFRPAANENGAGYDSFTFSVNDGTVDSASTYTMTVNVTAVNDAPTAADNAVTTNEDTDHTFSASEFGFTDVDSDSLDHVTIETLPTEGTLLLDGVAVSAGDEIATADITNLVFRPAANENGAGYDSFTFSVNDGTVDSASTYTMTVNVTAVNDAPTAADNAVTTNEDTDHTFSASEFGFTDVDSDSLDHVTIETLPTEGTLLLDGVAVSAGDEIATADITNLVFRPAANENGAGYDSFTFSVNDGTVDSASTYTMTVNVTAVNDAPTADDDTINVAAGTPATGNVVTANDTDPDGDSLTVSAIAEGDVDSPITGTYGTFTLNSDGSYTYTVDTLNADVIAWQSGDPALTETFTYTVSDGNGGTDTATITVNASGQNDAPTAADNAVTTNEDTDHTFSESEFNFTDPDGDSLDHISIETLPSNGTLLLNGVAVSLGQNIPAADISTLVFRPAADGNGDDYDSFTFSVNDGTVDSGSYTMTVNVDAVNDAPTAVDDTINVTVGTPATGNVVTANDTDPDSDPLTVSAIAGGSVGSAITGTYGSFTLNSNGSYTYTVDTLNADVIAWKPGDAVLTETFTYTVSDGNGGTNDATITVNASGQNDAPTAADNAVTTDEDTDHTFSESEFGFTDVDSDSLDHVTIETLPSKGTLLLDGSAVSAGDEIAAADIANLVFRPAADGNGDDYDSFTFSVNDGTVDSGSYTMTVNVDTVNDAPTAADNAVTTNEDTDHTFDASEFGFTDVDSDSLDHVTIETLPSKGTLLLDGSAVSAGDEIAAADITNLVFRPAADGNGDDYDSFTFSVNDGTVDSSSYRMTVNVTPVNDVPTITAATENDFTEGSTSADDTVSVFNIGDTETSDSNLELSISNTTYYSITNNNDGTATVTLTTAGANYVNAGNDLPSYTVTVKDESNATATATHDPTVTPTDDTPIITATTENNFTEGSTSTGDTVAVFDVDDEETADGSLLVTIISGNDNGYYEISYDNAGTATVTLTTAGADYVNAGNDLPEYTVQVSDGSLTATTSHNPTTLENTKPEASNNTITTLEDTSYTFSSNDFGFTDDDGNTLSSVTVSSLGTNGNGTFTLNGVAISGSTTVTKAQIDNGLLKFTPSSGDNGSSYNTYTFTVNDGTDDSSSSYTMTINVTAVNDAPVATDDASSVDEDSRVRVKKNGDDLINDDSDPENDSLKVTLIKVLGGSNNSISNGSSITITGTYGQLTVNSFGGYTYRANQDAADTLDTGESAKDIFVYTVSDGNGGTDTGTLTITINGVEDNPNAVKDNVSLNISENSTLTGNAITNDIDPDDSLTIVGCGQGQNPNNGTPKTVGNTFNSNYGQMTINENGSYTFVAFNNINELLDPGQSVTEKFYYTISDGNSTSTAMIELTIQRDNVVQELTRKEQKQIKKQIANERLNQPSTIRLLNNTTPAKTIEQTANALDNISNTKKLSFNEGIKLVDLVAETGSLQTTDGSLDKVRAKEKDGQLNLSFKVSTDLGNQIVRYEGVMPDGSKLPDWIKVDPQTGKTTTNIPEGVELVDFIIVTTDQQNNKKEIAVSIDPKEIKADKEIFKQAKKQNASLSVDQSGNVNIVQKDESGNVNKTETRNLNANEKQNSSNNIITQDLNLDNTSDIKNIIETIKSDQIYQLQTITNGEGFEIKVPDSIIGSFEKTKLVLKDGSVLPDWVEFDPITGEINANPPEDVDKLEFKLIIERDGEIIVKDLAVDVGGDDNAQILDDIENAKFIAFKDQLNKEHENWEEYGSNIINRL